MRAIDTNVVARFLLNDDPGQSPIARNVIRSGVHIAPTVILELAWLLGSRYRQPREVIAAALSDLVDIPSVHLADARQMRWAIERYRDGADLADMIHIVASGDVDAFASFEKRLARLAGPDTPIPIETLA